MRTDGAIITNAGQELLSYALANNKQVNFTKVKLGKGDVNTFDEAKKLTDVVSFYKQIPIASIARNNAGIVRIRSSFTNADFPLQVVLKEIGVFAVVEGKSEVLFGYVNDGEGESFPPGSSGNIVERVRDIYVGVSTNTQVTAVVDRSVVYATIYDLEEEIAKCAKKITRVNPGNGIHGGGTLGEDMTVSIKSNDTSINLDATNGITLKKTTSWLNDAAQLFTAKGALNLFNTLTTNFTDAINVAKEALRLDIVKKTDKGTYGGTSGDLKIDIDTRLPHGGYTQTAQDLKMDINGKLPTRVVKSIINVNQWSSLLDIHSGGTFKVVITYGRGNVVAKGIFLITLGHNDKANIITLATHDYSIANFSLRIRMKDDRGVLEMLDIANKGAIPENSLQDVYLDIFDVSDGIGFTGFTIFTPPATDGRIACSVETKHGSMYYNNHRLWHTGDFNPDDKENKFSKNSGFNLNKTDLTENDSNKVFTPKGALDLKNWLVTNYTTLMNNIRDTLNNSINTKLNHGGYSSTAQQLKNEIDTKLPFSEAWKLFGKEIGANDNSILNTKIPGNYFFQVNTHPKFRVANLEVKALNIFQDHFRQYMYNYDDLTTYVRNVGAGSDTDNPWVAELNTFNVNKFYCPHRIGDIISSTNSANPAATWIGTSWEKLEYCFLYGYNSVGERGGNSAINLTVAQLPPHNMGSNYLRRVGGDGSWDYRPSVSVHPDDASYFNSDTIGSGQPINIMPPYYTVFMWKRIS